MRFALLLLAVTPVWACTCSGPSLSVKQAWEKSPIVFLGAVESADPDLPPQESMFRPQSVRLRVEDAFKGVLNGQIIELHQGPDSCSAKFRTGARAVFYLERGTKSGTVFVPVCTRALGNAEPAGDDLLFLKGLPRSAIGTRLSGEVRLYEDSPAEGFHRVGGIPNLQVKITDARGAARETVTNAAGTYEVFGLPPGRYSVDIAAPRGLKIYFRTVSGSPELPGEAAELVPNGGASVNFGLTADTRISGRLLDERGEPLSGICVDLNPVAEVQESASRFFDCTKDGRFQMERMPPGEYRLVARDPRNVDGRKTESTLYYPGLRDRRRAAIVSVEAGTDLEQLDIRIPAAEERYQVSGRVLFADGVPAAGASVKFTSPEAGYAEYTSSADDGSFSLAIIAGMEGQLSSTLVVLESVLRSCPGVMAIHARGMLSRIDAAPLSLPMDRERENVRLELQSPSCPLLLPSKR